MTDQPSTGKTDAIEELLNSLAHKTGTYFAAYTQCMICGSALDSQAWLRHSDWCPVPRAREQLAGLKDRLASAERSEQEMRGVVETYGKLEASQLLDRDQLEMRWRVSLAVFEAGGFEVFYAGIREARKNFEAWQKSPFAARTSVEGHHG